MPDYYLDGEERFGAVSSFFYSLGSRFSRMGKICDFVVNDMKNSKFSEILDVGTGPGDIPIMLAKRRKYKIFAVDPSEAMIRIAKARSKGLEIRYALGSSRYLPFKNKFDLIFSVRSFHHWAKKEESLRYLSKFLKRNGEIRIYEYERRELTGIGRCLVSAHSASKTEMIGIVKRSGLNAKGVLQKGGIIRIAMSK